MAVFPSSGSQTFSTDITTPSSSITVQHGLGRTDVAVVAYDDTGTEVELGVQVLDPDTVQLTTVPELPFSGKVVVF